MKFQSQFSNGPKMTDFSQAEVKNEPMMFNCDARAAAELGGPSTIYKDWDEYLNGCGKEQGKRLQAPTNQLIYFDAHTFHRGTSAVANGWRWFGRVSIDTGRKPTNEVRRQVQVYMGVVNAGW